MKPETKREVLIARDAFNKGISTARARFFTGDQLPGDAARMYPLPKITRQRVVEDPASGRWTVTDLGLAYRRFGGEAMADYFPTPARLAIWNDLLARPTEEAEDDG